MITFNNLKEKLIQNKKDNAEYLKLRKIDWNQANELYPNVINTDIAFKPRLKSIETRNGKCKLHFNSDGIFTHATSYNWYPFAIYDTKKDTLVINDHPYSQTTNAHIGEVRWLLRKFYPTLKRIDCDLVMTQSDNDSVKFNLCEFHLTNEVNRLSRILKKQKNSKYNPQRKSKIRELKATIKNNGKFIDLLKTTYNIPLLPTLTTFESDKKVTLTPSSYVTTYYWPGVEEPLYIIKERAMRCTSFLTNSDGNIMAFKSRDVAVATYINQCLYNNRGEFIDQGRYDLAFNCTFAVYSKAL